MTPSLAALRAELKELADPVRAVHSLRFFKTGPGQYGEGDKFLGLTVPIMRGLVRKYRDLDDASALDLLESSWHEERLVGLLLLVEGYDRGDESRRNRIHRAYLANTRQINNWDLVDASVAELLLRDTHDLIHKAVGWMLREVGKRDRKALDGFLKRHYQKMPRTMLRYAIERHPERVRKQYLAGTI